MGDVYGQAHLSGRRMTVHASNARQRHAAPVITREIRQSHAALIRNWIWRDFINMSLGAWLIATALTYDNAMRSVLVWNDIICGAVIILLSVLALSPRLDNLRWALCVVGLWLLSAPLLLWAPTAAIYNNDTLVGAMVIVLSVLIPDIPGITHHAVEQAPGAEVPPGWSYSPSTWMQRGPIIAVALMGFFLSRYLASYQLGYISWPWDPVFGEGTRRVLDSEVSKAWPVSDAGLGAVAYLIEALTGAMGGRNRWRTMPWMVLLFGVLVVPLGVVSIVLVILQPVAVGAWCGICLFTAALMLIMVSPALDEVIASCQFLLAARRKGDSVWRTFWFGGTISESPASGAQGTRSYRDKFIAALDLDNVPWNMFLAAAVGLWIMAAPAVLASTDAAADSDHLAGALIVTFAVIAFSEIARTARLLLIPLGLWLIAAPWLLEGFSGAARISDMIAGLAIILLSISRGRIEQRFGGWNRLLR